MRSIRQVAELICASQRAVALTGAGISTPSGIPDFRSPDSGLWHQVDPFEVASLTAFRYHPQRFFEWMRPLAIQLHQAQPNPAHYGLAQLEQSGYLKAIITQNIDGLHQRAGSKNVLEVHGSLESLSCVGCFRQVAAQGFIQPYLEHGQIPQCPHCGSVLKPDIILFGEQLPIRTWLKAQEWSKTCDLMLVVGSSLEVLPAAGLPMRAVENGARLVIINRMETYIDVRADVILHEDVAEVIPRIVEEVLGECKTK